MAIEEPTIYFKVMSIIWKILTWGWLMEFLMAFCIIFMLALMGAFLMQYKVISYFVRDRFKFALYYLIDNSRLKYYFMKFRLKSLFVKGNLKYFILIFVGGLVILLITLFIMWQIIKARAITGG